MKREKGRGGERDEERKRERRGEREGGRKECNWRRRHGRLEEGERRLRES
jgi:hypothetical protein